MRTIWKYKIAYRSWQTIKVPYGSEILSVQIQHNEPHIWVMIPNDCASLIDKQIEVFGTGSEINVRESGIRQFIGTIQDGPFVFHVFEFKPDEYE